MKIVMKILKPTLVLLFGAIMFIAGYYLSNVRFDQVTNVEKSIIGYKVTVEQKDILGKVVDSKTYFTTDKKGF